MADQTVVYIPWCIVCEWGRFTIGKVRRLHSESSQSVAFCIARAGIMDSETVVDLYNTCVCERRNCGVGGRPSATNAGESISNLRDSRLTVKLVYRNRLFRHIME